LSADLLAGSHQPDGIAFDTFKSVTDRLMVIVRDTEGLLLVGSSTHNATPSTGRGGARATFDRT
jgi:hypothetical protein